MTRTRKVFNKKNRPFRREKVYTYQKRYSYTSLALLIGQEPKFKPKTGEIMLNFRNTLLAISLSLGATLSTSVPATASWLFPGQRFEVYKISNLTQEDIINACHRAARRGFASMNPVRYTSHKVHCNITYNRDIHYNDSRSRGDFGFGDYIYNDNRSNNHLRRDQTFEATPIEMNTICNRKHGLIGAFVGDGGYSCYDNYRTWRR